MTTLTNKNEEISKRAASRKFYQLIIRWHFFCGLIFIPLIIVISISGCIYLFEDEYEEYFYDDLLFVAPQANRLPPSILVSKAKQAFPELRASHVKILDDTTRSAQITFREHAIRHKQDQISMEWAGNGPEKVPMVMNRERTTVFINPYTGEILGSLKSGERLMAFMKDLHGNLLTGKFGTKFVELTSCWLVALMVTGLIMWWPRGKVGIRGTLIPRLNSNKRLFWRDLHAVPAFYFSFFIVFLIISGLPWTDVWGDAFHTIQRDLKMNAPAGFHSRMMKSDYIKGRESKISIDQVLNQAREKGYQGEIKIKIPHNKTDTFAILQDSDDPAQRASMHFDQYTGEVLSASKWEEIPLLAKAVTYGIKLHRGEYFGVWNLVLVLITTLVLIFMAILGIVLWLQRRPNKKLGAPKRPKSYKEPRWVIITTVGMGIFMPLMGASLVLFILGDWIYSKSLKSSN